MQAVEWFHYLCGMDAKLTVVVPVHNRAQLMIPTLDSIARQTLRPMRVVLVDNASTDGSGDVLRQWQAANNAPDFGVTVAEEPRPGAPGARNLGLKMVETEWTMFFDSDDIMTPDHCERALRTAAENPEADIVGWDEVYCYGDTKKRIRPFASRSYRWHNLMHGTFATHRYMARTALLRKAGGWNESVDLYDDIELGARLLALSPRIVRAKGAPTVRIIAHAESISYSRPTEMIARAEPAFASITANMPQAMRHWVDLRRLHFAATEGKHDPRAAESARAVMNRQHGLRRMVYLFAWHYTRLGLPGVARLLQPFMARQD